MKPVTSLPLQLLSNVFSSSQSLMTSPTQNDQRIEEGEEGDAGGEAKKIIQQETPNRAQKLKWSQRTKKIIDLDKTHRGDTQKGYEYETKGHIDILRDQTVPKTGEVRDNSHQMAQPKTSRRDEERRGIISTRRNGGGKESHRRSPMRNEAVTPPNMLAYQRNRHSSKQQTFSDTKRSIGINNNNNIINNDNNNNKAGDKKKQKKQIKDGTDWQRLDLNPRTASRGRFSIYTPSITRPWVTERSALPQNMKQEWLRLDEYKYNSNSNNNNNNTKNKKQQRYYGASTTRTEYKVDRNNNLGTIKHNRPHRASTTSPATLAYYRNKYYKDNNKDFVIDSPVGEKQMCQSFAHVSSPSPSQLRLTPPTRRNGTPLKFYRQIVEKERGYCGFLNSIFCGCFDRPSGACAWLNTDGCLDRERKVVVPYYVR